MSGLSRQDIDEILRLVEASTFDELKLEIGDTKIELRRHRAGRQEVAPSAPTRDPAASDETAENAPQASQPVAATVVASGGGSEVPAPLLGTFYLCPKPGSPPFIKLGDHVEPDTVIGIIEVMKLMTSVTAGLAGTITAIHAKDGELVEHGQALISVRPD